MYIALAALLLIIDQASKVWVQRNLPLGASRPLIVPWLHLTHVENDGAAFSLFAGRRWLFIVVAIGFLLSAWIYRAAIADQNKAFRLGITLALAGAGGNLIDRIRIGNVVDFFDLGFFPVFNVADCCIVIGFGLIFFTQLQKEN